MNHIIYFDGVCNLCNWSVRFILKLDKKAIFSFASLQSENAQSQLKRAGAQKLCYDSVVYQQGEHIYLRSDAVLHILKTLGGIWGLFYGFKIIPKPIRDWFYDLIARNRYQWFGKKNNCMIPSAEIKARFLD